MVVNWKFVKLAEEAAEVLPCNDIIQCLVDSQVDDEDVKRIMEMQVKGKWQDIKTLIVSSIIIALIKRIGNKNCVSLYPHDCCDAIFEVYASEDKGEYLSVSYHPQKHLEIRYNSLI